MPPAADHPDPSSRGAPEEDGPRPVRRRASERQGLEGPTREQIDLQWQAAAYFAVLRTLQPKTPVTWFLLGLLPVAFVASLLAGVSLMAPTNVQLLDVGALYGPRATRDEPWRLLTTTLLHAGPIHLLFNWMALKVAGPDTERQIGSRGFAVLYVLSGIAGSLASIAWRPDGLGVGASGAVFGVFGAQVGFLIREGRTSMPNLVRRAMWKGLGQFILLNAVLGFMMPQIDWAAHLGGLVAGILVGMALAAPLGPASLPLRQRRPFLVLPVALAVLAGVWALLPRAPDIYR